MISDPRACSISGSRQDIEALESVVDIAQKMLSDAGSFQGDAATGDRKVVCSVRIGAGGPDRELFYLDSTEAEMRSFVDHSELQNLTIIIRDGRIVLEDSELPELSPVEHCR